MNEEYEEVNPEIWKPLNKGDEIKGFYLGVQKEVGEYKSNLYSIETQTGIKNFFGNIVLNDKMIFIKVGENIKIEYLGEVKGKKKTYKDFKISKKK